MEPTNSAPHTYDQCETPKMMQKSSHIYLQWNFKHGTNKRTQIVIELCEQFSNVIVKKRLVLCRRPATVVYNNCNCSREIERARENSINYKLLFDFYGTLSTDVYHF